MPRVASHCLLGELSVATVVIVSLSALDGPLLHYGKKKKWHKLTNIHTRSVKSSRKNGFVQLKHSPEISKMSTIPQVQLRLKAIKFEK